MAKRGHDTKGQPGNDNQPASGHIIGDTLMAIRFYSRLPTGKHGHELPDLNRIVWGLPFANLIIGAVPALVLLASARMGMQTLFGTGLAVAAFAIVTGAMSEDALADAADGLFGGTTPERRLDILKDSRHGSYGVLAIVFLILLKVAALAAIAVQTPLGAALCWLAATGLARSFSLYAAKALGPARNNGTAAASGHLRGNGFWAGAVFATVLGFILAAPFAGALGYGLALVPSALLAWGWTRLCDRMVGGITGDLIGALQALIEIAVLGTFMVLIA